MDGKGAGKEWKGIVAALGVCLGAFLLNTRAWHVGYEGSATGLLGCHFLRCLLLLLAWVAVLATFNAAAGGEKPPAGTPTPARAAAFSALLIPACVGCYPMWPTVLALLLPALLVALMHFRRQSGPPADGAGTRRAVLYVGLAAVLFTVTWYECAGVTRQALRGLGERIEAHGGSDKLLAWAAEVIAARQRREQALPLEAPTVVGLAASPPGPGGVLTAAAWVAVRAGLDDRGLARGEIPDWVEQLMGRFEGVRSGGVYLRTRGVLYGEDDPCVVLYAGSSAYHFEIFLRPSRHRRDPPAWWFGEGTAGLEWRPGIFLETGGK
jgi:hypothetical protein